MAFVKKDTIEALIQKVSSKMQGHAIIILIGSAASIVGSNTMKNTQDVDTYNTLKKDFVSAWDEACDEIGLKLTIGTSSVFTPPDGFEDRIHTSEISTSKITVNYIDVSPIGSHSMAIINFKELLLELFGSDTYEKFLPLVNSLKRE